MSRPLLLSDENWELNIGQILPSPQSAKLFLREPLIAVQHWRLFPE